MKMICHFKAYYLNQGNVEIFPGVEIIGLCVNDTHLEICFKPGYVFGRQWMKLKELEKPFVFHHHDREYRILFTDEELSPAEIKAKLTPNYL